MDARRGVASKSRFGKFVALDVASGDEVPGEQAADQVIDWVQQQGINPVVLGAADQWQVYLARRSVGQAARLRTLTPSPATMDLVVDKQAQYEAARRWDIHVAEFANAKAVFDGTTAWEAFPAIIKPRWSHAGRAAIGGKAVRVENCAELAQGLARLDRETNVGAYIVQEVIRGADDCLYAYLACYDADGREVAWLVKRKLRQSPPGLGDGCYDVTCVNDAVAEAARRLLSGIGYRGLVGVEFKQDPETDRLTLIEINPRTVSTNQLAIRAGVDFPWLAYQMILGQPVAPAMEGSGMSGHPYAVNVHHVNEERDFRAFLERRRGGEVSLWGWLREVLAAESYALWDSGDPWPFLWTLLSGAKRRLRPSRRSG